MNAYDTTLADLDSQIDDTLYSYEQMKRLCESRIHLMPKGFIAHVNQGYADMLKLQEKMRENRPGTPAFLNRLFTEWVFW